MTTDTCQKHDQPQTHEYDFGCLDAIVITYKCGCADVVDVANFNAVTHCKSYTEAASKARLIVALNR